MSRKVENLANSYLRTPSGLGDTTFPTMAEHDTRGPSRRPLPSIMSSFGNSVSSMLPASLRSAQTPSNPIGQDLKPPAMKRPRAAATNGARKADELVVPGRAMSRTRDREIRSIEPNGEGDMAGKRVTRVKPTAAKATTKLPAREKRSTRSHSAASSTSGATTEVTSPSAQEIQLQTVADDWLRDVIKRCALAYRALAAFQCQEALRQLDTLPVELQTSAWALDIAARSFYEMANYVLAQRAFKALIAIEPYRVRSMEYFSTLLWHLADPPALSHLAQHLTAINRESPQAWIAAGNSFSLQKDHEEAMRCFRRATQVDPSCAYAWTLCGHEAIETEEYERALAFFRSAIRTDARHYNAWSVVKKSSVFES
jgi:anaphase-promoting complex subunit 3